MPGDEPQDTAEQLDDEHITEQPEYERGDEAVDPPDDPMAVGEAGPDTPDPYSLADRELRRGWRPEDRETTGERWVDSSATAEDTEPAAIADEWRTVTEPSAEEEAINETPPPRYREEMEDEEWELQVPDDEAAEEPTDPEEADPGPH